MSALTVWGTPNRTTRTRQGTTTISGLRAFAHCRTQVRQITPKPGGDFW